MTEEHWQSWSDPRAFLQSLLYQLRAPEVQVFSARKLRLFAVACCRRVLSRCSDSRVRAAVEAAEVLADARTNEERSRHKAIRRAVFANGTWLQVVEGQLAKAVIGKGAWDAAIKSSFGAGYIVGGPSAEAEQERVRQGALLRDVIGDPLRSACFHPRWQTSVVVGLARAMYESRDFSAMPILGDALEEAGCGGADILAHCRAASPHTRGCWIVDSILGKG